MVGTFLLAGDGAFVGYLTTDVTELATALDASDGGAIRPGATAHSALTTHVPIRTTKLGTFTDAVIGRTGHYLLLPRPEL